MNQLTAPVNTPMLLGFLDDVNITSPNFLECFFFRLNFLRSVHVVVGRDRITITVG
jgi:hypothetical protein